MVKSGYKQTDVGIIPEEWEDKKLGEIGKVCMCKRIFADQTSDIGEIPFYKIGTFGNQADAYIPRDLYEEYVRKFSYPSVGDVLISAAGTLGRTVVYNGKESYFQDSNIVWLNIDKNQICNNYLYHYYKVIEWASSEGSTIARLYNGIICDTHIALPDVKEQEKIAAVLSEMDDLISLTEKQIAKKKAIKQGAMQELLTGKNRLPGFENEWEEICLGDVCTFYGGGTPDKKKTDWWNGNIPWISSSDLQENDITSIKIGRFITHEALEKSATQLCPLNSVLVVTRVGVGKVAVTPCSICTSQDFISIVSRAHNSYFLAYTLLPIMKRLAEQSQGTSIKGVTSNEIKQIVIRTPRKEEQKAIAETLFYMDEEIRLLEKKLGKCRQIKQGMMQQLLTGKIRLTDKGE